MDEKWEEIEEYENYMISSLGNVWNKKYNRYLKPAKNSITGYYVINLYENNIRKMFSIHRLVASHFIPNPEGKQEVDHINREPSDNRISNLRWATTRENNLNKYIKGCVLFHKRDKKYQVNIQGKYYGSYNTREQAEEMNELIITLLNNDDFTNWLNNSLKII